MSQYPPQSPYQFPQHQPPIGYAGPYGYDPYGGGGGGDPLAKCRRAAMLMFVFGGLLLLLGGCAAGLLNVPGMEAAIAAQPGGLPPDTSFEELRGQLTLTGGVMAGVGLLGIVLGIFVRGGSRGAAIGSLVLAFLVGIYCVLNLMGALFLATRGAGAQALMGACLSVFAIGLTVWLIVWLFQAVGAAGRLASAVANGGAMAGWPGQGYPPQQQPMYGQPGYPQQQPHQQWGPPPPPPQQGQWPPQQQHQQWGPPPPPPSPEATQQPPQQNWPPPPPPGNPG